MPTIRNVGEIDWAFSNRQKFSSQFCLRLDLDKPLGINLATLTDKDLENVVYRNGLFTHRVGEVKGAISELMVEFTRCLSAQYKDTVVAAFFRSSPQSVYFIVSLETYRETIERPTRYIESLARKMLKWAREFEEQRAA